MARKITGKSPEKSSLGYMNYRGLIKESMLLYRRYHSIMLATFSYPILMAMVSFLYDPSEPQVFLMPLLIFLLWSLSMLITNMFAVLPGDLRTFMIFPMGWSRLIAARNSILFLAVMLSILTVTVVTIVLYDITLGSVIVFLVDSMIVLIVVVSSGNILSARSPRPFPQNTFCWKALAIIVIAVFANTLLVVSNLFGELWYAVIIATALTLAVGFYRLSVSRSARILEKNVHNILDAVNE